MLVRLLDTLDNAAMVWKDVKAQAPVTQQNIVPLTKLWSQKTEEEMEAYQAVVSKQVSIAFPTRSKTQAVVIRLMHEHAVDSRAHRKFALFQPPDTCSTPSTPDGTLGIDRPRPKNNEGSFSTCP